MNWFDCSILNYYRWRIQRLKIPKRLKKNIYKENQYTDISNEVSQKNVIGFQASKDNASTGYVDYTTINSLECGLF